MDWVPAFAGMTKEKSGDDIKEITHPSPSPRGGYLTDAAIQFNSPSIIRFQSGATEL